jgi:effector-binding domain-containing protein
VRIRTEPAAQEAYVRITKAQVAYPGILEAYQALERYLTRTGATASGPPREVYVTDWSAANPDDPACEVAWPIDTGKG